MENCKKGRKRGREMSPASAAVFDPMEKKEMEPKMVLGLFSALGQ